MVAFCRAVPDRYLSLKDADLELATKLRAGLPTASNDALDGDVILAAQTLSLGVSLNDIVVASTNPTHLSRFVSAELRTNIAC